MNIAIVTSGGKGKRSGLNYPKQFYEVQGKPLFVWSIEPFQNCDRIGRIIFIHPFDENPQDYEEILKKHNLDDVFLVAGGATRSLSVRNGFQSLQSAAPEDNILIHDAVRPLLPDALLTRVIDAVEEWGAVVPVLPLTETIKEVQDQQIVGTTSREKLFVAQTPQAFQYKILRAAYEKIDSLTGFTDESMIVERAGFSVRAVAGEARNIKVTNQEDFKILDYYLRGTGCFE